MLDHCPRIRQHLKARAKMIKTEAWVLYVGSSRVREVATLQREVYSFPDLVEHEVLAEPLYGCWEANMTHALERDPIDVCRRRNEQKIVLGNAGVVRILKLGPGVTKVKEGDICLLAAIGTWDASAFPIKVVGYDAPHTIGLLARQVKLHENQVCPLAEGTKYSLRQWAAFSLRYATAWSNWKVAYGCWRQQVTEEDCRAPTVWGWGGGVSLAELTLAQHFGCPTAMIASSDERLALIQELGIRAVDRRQFDGLNFDEARFESDTGYKRSYLKAEVAFLNLVRELTGGAGVCIFVDNIGTPVYRATLRALARQGVVTTTGWKHGMTTCSNRAIECISRHIHVHTHGCKYSEGIDAMQFAEKTGWLPPVESPVYDWMDIPQLAHDYAAGTISSYFPLYQVNAA
jgi:NADPH:quinone reductase-like Zn-dependent oxidoreductase